MNAPDACLSHLGTPKVRYSERRLAKRHAKEAMRAHGAKASVYACPEPLCLGWHVTTRPGRDR